jgi:quercetin dioxygenase-like cupin family protein
MSVDDLAPVNSATASDVWGDLLPDPESPGFSVRTTYPMNPGGVEVMLERWEAGTEEPPHFHPGDDMTIVVEGTMSTQLYRREGNSLVADGGRVHLHKGDVGYNRAGRIHDAKYIDTCELVYVHNGAFALHRAEVEVG